MNKTQRLAVTVLTSMLAAPLASATALSELLEASGTLALAQIEVPKPPAAMKRPSELERIFNASSAVRDWVPKCLGAFERQERVMQSDDLYRPDIGFSGEQELWNILTARCACSTSIRRDPNPSVGATSCQDRAAWEFEDARKQARSAEAIRVITAGMRAKYPDEDITSIKASREEDGGTWSPGGYSGTAYRTVWFVRTGRRIYKASFVRGGGQSLENLRLEE